jgi:hypothetical protein
VRRPAPLSGCISAKIGQMLSALLVLILVRLTTLGLRFQRRRWLVAGWA